METAGVELESGLAKPLSAPSTRVKELEDDKPSDQKKKINEKPCDEKPEGNKVESDMVKDNPFNGVKENEDIGSTPNDALVPGGDENQLQDKSTTETVENLHDRIENDDDEDDDDGDPIPSGTGSVSKDCSASELHGWSEVLPKWHAKLHQRPKGLEPLVRCGIPDPLRGEVWQLLSGAHQSADLMERYRIFLTRSAPTEQIILRDVHRTYPAHENFRTGGSSSLLDSLFKVCKAYAVFDEEVGYCQGLSFLVAALLLHMPEEQAFCVFVRIMQHYGLRNLFRNNFDELYLKFYQLERLLEEHMPDLHQHFERIGIEPFTYASQWFLTVFTAKFPLNAVFYIMDIFLLDGMNTIFQIALALLSSSKQELLALDFEGVLKYFRVQMPKRYRSQDNVQQLINASSGVSLKRLKKHAKNYELIKQKEKLLENPVVRLQRENTKLTENNLRLEQENDDLARDLVASKIQLRSQLDELEDKIENLNRALSNSNQECRGYLSTISDMEDEKARLEVEVNQLKEVCRRELQRAETESTRDSSIISDYKKICSQLSKRLDSQMLYIDRFIDSAQDLLRDNESCKNKLCHSIFQSEAEKLMVNLKSDKQDNSDSMSSPKSKQNSSRKSSASDHSNQPVGAYLKQCDSSSTSSETKIRNLSQHIDELEVELARTKLALVEAECKCQQLTHDLSVGASVKTTSNSGGNQTGSLSSRLDFMTRRSPKVASNAFAKINNLISERMLNISDHLPASSQSSLSNENSVQAASISPTKTMNQQYSSNSSNDIRNPRDSTNNQCQDRC